MLVRYFAAARAAAGVDEERYDLPEGASLDDLITVLLAAERPEPPAGTPPLARIISRSSFSETRWPSATVRRRLVR